MAEKKITDVIDKKTKDNITVFNDKLQNLLRQIEEKKNELNNTVSMKHALQTQQLTLLAEEIHKVLDIIQSVVETEITEEVSLFKEKEKESLDEFALFITESMDQLSKIIDDKKP